MITVTGKGNAASDLPLDLAAARSYFEAVPDFLAKIEAVDTVKSLARPGCYLVTHLPMGGFKYQVVMVACLQSLWHADGMTMTPLDFDLGKVASDFPVVKGFIEGGLKLEARPGDHTHARLDFAVTVELPIAGALHYIPRPMIQATADAIMGLRVRMVVSSLFRKVLGDFEPALASH